MQLVSCTTESDSVCWARKLELETDRLEPETGKLELKRHKLGLGTLREWALTDTPEWTLKGTPESDWGKLESVPHKQKQGDNREQSHWASSCSKV